ncbi:ATP-dependent RNA helicase DDX54 [Phocoena sinus]|uniref:ATP-dependent RNA helicase DDX54 n=1 Tax=Phocoena sinus TaxID=42100 RepID=A0A8C9E267_PHOSS|nr:ATP-dependent RNA helicase DDX54 [Phocoena sinus]
MAAGTRPAAAPRSRAAMAQWRKKKGLRKRRGAASQSRSSDSEDGEFEIQAEDDARAQKLGPGRPLPTFPTSECTSDVEPDTREMVRAQNKKKKKSGGFQSMGLSYPVFKGIMKKGYKVPTPIQRKTIPVILDGKDVVAMARTGSGKTACFLIPMFERLKTRSAQTGARALILSPTRELALQTMKFTKELGKFTGLKTALILGGDKMEDQFAALHENPDIIIATPGRLVHVAVEMNLKLQSVEYVVFDEADRLFEMGFAEQLQEIIARLPGGHQTVLFSATLPKLLVEFAQAGLMEPVLIRLDVDSKLNEQLKTSFFLVREDAKAAVLLHLLRSLVRPQDQTVVFVATKHHAEYLSELLTTQRMSCAHIYSALDQTARKINLAKFMHGKCSALIVTDLAARGLDIPLLDNVINYSFPAKGKLFLHRVGRVARAGLKWHGLLLGAPDEVPYLLDLHLFLGRALTLARPHEEPSGAGGGDGVLGRVPQGVVDDEDCGLRTSLETIAGASGPGPRGRQRPAAVCAAHGRRPHPSPSGGPRSWTSRAWACTPSSARASRRRSCSSCGWWTASGTTRSRATIFEINASSRDLSSQVMRAKRQKDRKCIASFRQKRQERQEGPAVPASSLPAPQEEQPEKEEAAGDSVEDLFTEVVGRKRQQPGPDRGAKRRREEARQRDQVFYIPYRPKDFDSERGLSIGGDGGAFEQQVAGAVLDLMGDEGQSLTKGQQQLKWDRKKKRFVRQSGQEDKKKIKTESGRYISSSYKRDLYQKWKQKQKIDDRDSEEEGTFERRGPERRGGKRGRGQGASQPRTPGAPTGRVRSELKDQAADPEAAVPSPETAASCSIGGLKQLSARNRRRARELQQGAFGRGAHSKKGKMRKSL